MIEDHTSRNYTDLAILGLTVVISIPVIAMFYVLLGAGYVLIFPFYVIGKLFELVEYR